MRKEDLRKGRCYVHTTKVYSVEENRLVENCYCDKVVFIDIVEHAGFWSAKFKTMTGKTVEVADWAVERHISEIEN